MQAAASRMRKTTAVIALGIAALFAAVDFAEARRAGSSGFGSRGARTFSAPAPTNTAPGTASPVQRTMTPQPAQGQQATPGAGARQQQAAQPSRGLFGGMGGALLGGLLMGGLLGMLFGGGMGGFAGFLGLILQVALIGFLIMLAMRFFGRRQQPAAAATGGAAPNFGGTGPDTSRTPFSFGGAGGTGTDAGTGAAAPFQAPVMETPLELEEADFDRFEQMLAEVQEAYGREDYAALRRLATPEAMSFLAEELGELASAGKRNAVSDVKLLQGDLSEAWSEGSDDYATVAMRFSALDAVLDRNSGRVLSGSLEEPQESTELWTFRRQKGGEWTLAAIQGTE